MYVKSPCARYWVWTSGKLSAGWAVGGSGYFPFSSSPGPPHFPSPFLKTCFHFLCHIDKLFFKFLNRLLPPRPFSLSFCRKNTCCSHIWSFHVEILNSCLVSVILSNFHCYIFGSIFLSCKIEPQIFFLGTSTISVFWWENHTSSFK